MNCLEEKTIVCPYCGEEIDVLVDASISEQEYIEDCQVCCRPISFIVKVDISNEIILNVFSENE